jgi:hypothetical protein
MVVHLARALKTPFIVILYLRTASCRNNLPDSMFVLEDSKRLQSTLENHGIMCGWRETPCRVERVMVNGTTLTEIRVSS